MFRCGISIPYHADHAGIAFSPAPISHAKCRQYLVEDGIPSLEGAQSENPSLRQVKIVPPHLTFETGEMTLRVGKRT